MGLAVELIVGVAVAVAQLIADTTRAAARRLLFGKGGGVDPRRGFVLKREGGVVGWTRRQWRRARRYFGIGQGEQPVGEGGRST